MELDSYMAGFWIVPASTVLGVLGLLLVRWRFDARTLSACHEVGGYLLSVVGTLYAVLLGLIVVDSMARFQAARQTTDQEANALANIILFANGLPPAKRNEIRALSATYAELVVEKEWKEMDEGRHSQSARHTAVELFRAVCDFEPKTESEKAIYAAELAAVGELWNNRRIRIVTSTQGVPALEWAVLIVGGTITIMFTYFFIIENMKIQIAMTALLGLIISLNIYLVSMFGYPFSGDVKVDPGSFGLAQAIIEDRVELTPGQGQAPPVAVDVR
jgi:Protein of unknown function (DUF4239)